MKKKIDYEKIYWILTLAFVFLSVIGLAGLMESSFFIIIYLTCALLAKIASLKNKKQSHNNMKKIYKMSDAKSTSENAKTDIESYKNSIPYNPQNKEKEAEIEKIIKKTDPNFSKSSFKQQAYNYYIEYQKAIIEEKLDKLYCFSTEELVEKTKHISRDKILQNSSVVYSNITNYYKESTQEIIEYQLTVKGSKTNSKNDKIDIYYNTYRLIFVRNIGVYTKKSYELDNLNCPSCGAATNIISYGHCSHCGQIINTGKYSWILKDIDYWKEEN